MGKVRDRIPLGFNHHNGAQSWFGFDKAPDTEIIQRELPSAKKQLATLGGGNHFIEIQIGDDGLVWVMLHSGSRNFGLKTAKFYHEIAINLCNRWRSCIPHKDLSFLPIEDKAAKDYMDSMNFCLLFAKENRILMMDRICEALTETVGSFEILNEYDVHHNYAVWENHFGKNVLVHRKGATRAFAGDIGIIPGSMGSSSYIVSGLGNPDSFKTCSHGAGRKMGRKEAKENLDLKEEITKMGNIIHGMRNTGDLDEAPGAYREISEVMSNQADLTKPVVKLLPLANIKG